MNSPLPATPPAVRRGVARLLVNLLVALVVVAVAAATFVFSYDGVQALALLGGMSPKLARYYPGLFDAVLVIACVAIVVLRDGRWWARLWAWLVTIVVLGAIGTTDVLHAMDYSLRHRATEGVVAGAPIVAVLLAFSLLLIMLRQSRSPGSGDRDNAAGPAVAAPADLPALPAAVAVAEAATVETPAVPAGVAVRPAATPIALPAGPGAPTDPAAAATVQAPGPPRGPAVPGLPAPGQGQAPGEGRPSAKPEGDSPETESAAGEPRQGETRPAASRDTEPAELATPQPGAPQAGPPGAGSAAALPGAPGNAPKPADTQPSTDEPAPPTAESPAMPAPAVPGRAQRQPGRPSAQSGIRYAGGALSRPSRAEAASPTAEPGADADADQAANDGRDDRLAGLVYTAREDGTDAGQDAAADDDAEAKGRPHPQSGAERAQDEAEAAAPAGGKHPEQDDDTPPFATAPFAAVPGLNRVRSMPAPPADDEDE